jgi:hypothetical protein
VIENVGDAERDCRLIEQISPRRPAINQALFWLGMGLYLIGRLHIKEPRLPDPMLSKSIRSDQDVVKAVPVMCSEDGVKAAPVPAELGKPLPFEIRVLEKWIRSGAAQLLLCLTGGGFKQK